MKPKRPDSAKSGATRQTFDSDHFNQSKFSQTFTTNTTFQQQKKDYFAKYVEDKQKDPKYKHYKQQKLSSIPQVKPQLQKLNSKPFQKRSSKIEKGSVKKVQQNLGNTQIKTQIKQNIKKQNQSIKIDMGASKSFAQKNKQKMNAIKGGLSKIQNQSQQPKNIQKSKINFTGFSVNVPGKGSKKIQLKKEQKGIQIEQCKPINKQQNQYKQKDKRTIQKTVEQLRREEDLLQISRFIDEMQKKNADTYPQNYQKFCQTNQIKLIDNNSDLQKINIDDFLNQEEPNEMDYEKVKKNIQENQRIIERGDLSESRLTSTNGDNSSVDLDQLIEDQQQAESDQIFLSSISSQDLKKRNLFLTEVLKGKITKDQIQDLQKMEKSTIKMMKLQNTQQHEEDQIEFTDINMLKKKSNRLIQRNIIQASGTIYRDCDYLSQQNQKRLQNLLSGTIQSSPFQHTQMQMFRIRRIDQGINMYRQFSQSLQQNSEVMSEQCLPKDPILKKQAQKKILRLKIDNLNNRLIQVQNILVNQANIRQVVQKYKETRITQMGKSLIEQKNREFEQMQLKKQQIRQMLQKTQKQKASLQKILEEMQDQYNEYQKQTKIIQKMSEQELKKMQSNEISRQKSKIKQIEQSLKCFENESVSFQNYATSIKQNLQILAQIQNLQNSALTYQNYKPGETIQSLDEIFVSKAKQEEHQKDSNDHQNQVKTNNKQNQFAK